MRTEIDGQSLELLRALRGSTIQSVAGVRYPSVAGYSELRVTTTHGDTLSLTLRTVDVTAEFEVFVPVARYAQPFEASTVVDRYEIEDFRIANVFVLRRGESVKALGNIAPEGYVGSHPYEHVLMGVDAAVNAGAQLVDAGIAFDSSNGLSLEAYADSFPLVFQLRIALAGSAVPDPKRFVVV